MNEGEIGESMTYLEWVEGERWAGVEWRVAAVSWEKLKFERDDEKRRGT